MVQALGNGQRGNLGMVQMRVTPGPQNQAQRTQSVSPIGLVVNGLHCAASHTHTRLLSGCRPHVPTLNHAATWPLFGKKWPSCPSGAAAGQRPRFFNLTGSDYGTP